MTTFAPRTIAYSVATTIVLYETAIRLADEYVEYVVDGARCMTSIERKVAERDAQTAREQLAVYLDKAYPGLTYVEVCAGRVTIAAETREESAMR